ncbi:MAG: beta-N-acetylglucosaminidase domain-containing protein [Planctomycetes bacterium]|nr:beta-N-acetylglucosaminidase domain-containing protein [Planctomycetota bacterium]
MRTISALLALSTLLVVSPGCAAIPTGGADGPGAADSDRGDAWGDEWARVPGAARVSRLSVPDDARDLVLTVYPTPRRAAYGDVLLPLDGARFADETSDDVDALLRDAGLEIGFRELPPEGYALAITHVDGRTVVLTAARDAPGHRFAAQALAQVTTSQDGRGLVRACRVLDAPVFPLRGSKRPQAWEVAYRANFAWEAKDLPEFAGLDTVATFAPGSPLDATRPGVERILAAWRPWQARGVHRFCVKFDDVGFGMTAETALYFGTYAAALRSLVAALALDLRSRDPAAVVYLLPQTYWWNDRRLGPFARALRDAGGLSPDVGLVLTGPEIISDTIDAPGLVAARDLFGSVETAALIYDNLGREGDWGPLTGRDPGLASLCDGVFGERGTPVTRLTRLDWLWNPSAYDAERSWRRAVFELAGPSGYETLRSVCQAFRDGAPRAEVTRRIDTFEQTPAAAAYLAPVPRTALLKLLRSDAARVGAESAPAAARP